MVGERARDAQHAFCREVEVEVDDRLGLALGAFAERVEQPARAPPRARATGCARARRRGSPACSTCGSSPGTTMFVLNAGSRARRPRGRAPSRRRRRRASACRSPPRRARASCRSATSRRPRRRASGRRRARRPARRAPSPSGRAARSRSPPIAFWITEPGLCRVARKRSQTIRSTARGSRPTTCGARSSTMPARPRGEPCESVISRPADGAVVGRRLEEDPRTPAGVAVQRLELRDLHRGRIRIRRALDPAATPRPSHERAARDPSPPRRRC